MTRRQGLGVLAASAASYSRIWGANDRVRLGLIGAGNRGSYVTTVFQKVGPAQVAAVCDVWADRVDKVLTAAPGAKGYSDHRQLLDRQDVDAVLIATPDHWHKDITIDALHAGKDVYVEKPLTLKREEGPEIVKAVRTTGRVCQVGMQQRSGRVYLEAKQRFIDSGMLGTVSHVDAIWDYAPQTRDLKRDPITQPSNLDWARYLGSVKWRDWNPAMYLEFRAFLDFGGGRLTDFGVHWMDVVHMFMSVDAPVAVTAAGGIYTTDDERTAPDNVTALYEYGPSPAAPKGFMVNFRSLSISNGPEYQVQFFGDKGRLFINRNRYEFYPAQKNASPIVERFPGDITDAHVANFLECCKTRQRPHADVWIGHRSAQAALLSVQSYEEKRRIHFDGQREEIIAFG